jgi:hypothetical protein
MEFTSPKFYIRPDSRQISSLVQKYLQRAFSIFTSKTPQMAWALSNNAVFKMERIGIA